MSLKDEVKIDVIEYLENNNELLFNERDLQVHLSMYLASKRKYDDVDLEYFVPYKELNNYIWQSELRLDILVRKGTEYLPIELKYKTKSVKKDILRFNEKIKDVQVLKNQSAQNLGMYDFWKDVRRIELVRNRFNQVKNGLAVFVTNDKLYKNSGKPTSTNYQFSMSDGKHDRNKCWLEEKNTCAKTHPNFILDKEYEVKWGPYLSFDSNTFYYCIVEI